MADAERLVELFEEARGLPDEERAAFLERARVEDASLAADLEKLLGQSTGPLPTEPGSFARRIEEHYGSEADPHITLEGSGESDSDFTSEMVQRLAGRGENYGRYLLKGEVARGGQGAILRVWDEDLRRNLAMKVVLGKAEAAGDTPRVDSRTLGRFLEEAQVTGQLDHPGIVPVHELGLDSEGQVYFTMKLVKGRDLKAIFDLVHEGKESWTQTRALNVLLKVCEAMAYAHSKGVIHRDLKPGNVMVGKFGEVYVMDWGLARVLGRDDEKDIRIRPTLMTSEVRSERRDRAGDSPDSPLVTMDGDVVGTPAYMSPEQARGDLHAMGPHSDVYAVGAMLYHLLVGHMPYLPRDAPANNYAIWNRVLEGPPAPVRELGAGAPPELRAICEKAMARDPGARYSDMSELAEDLRAYGEMRLVRAYRPSLAARASLRWKRAPFIAKLGLVLVASYPVSIAISFLFPVVLLSDAFKTMLWLGPTLGAGLFSFASLFVPRRPRAVAILTLVLAVGVLFTIQWLERRLPYPPSAPGLDVLLMSGRHDRIVERVRATADEDWRFRDQLVLAEALSALGRPSEALECLDEAVERRSRSFRERLPEEMKELQPITSVFSADYRLASLKAFVLFELDRPDDALEALRSHGRFVEASSNSTVLNRQAWQVVDPDGDGAGDSSLALEQARRAAELAPTRAHIRDTLAWALLANGHHEEAIAESERALDLAPEEEKTEFRGYLHRMRSIVEAARAKEMGVDEKKGEAPEESQE